MNILYITNCMTNWKLVGCPNHHSNDLMFHGFHELFGTKVIDSTPIIPLYKDLLKTLPQHVMYGKGFTITGLIEEDKINDKFFDCIVYGNFHRCQDYLDLVTQIYPANRIIVLDGEDHRNIHPFSEKCLYFKRELIYDNKNLKPFSFCFPESKICTSCKTKIKEMAAIIPGDLSTYIFNEEPAYYEDYQESYYGLTTEKGGWDCMRHYEILGNRCIPYFLDLEKSPPRTMTHLPKALIKEGMSLRHQQPFSTEKYEEIVDQLFEYTKEHLTTKKMAEYILNFL